MGTGLIQPTHVIFLMLLAVLLFGAKRLPEIGRGLGKGMREFKDSVSGLTEIQDAVNGVQQVTTPSNVAGALVPGVKDVQETVSAAKDIANPLAPTAPAAPAAATETAAGDPAGEAGSAS